MSEPLEEPSQLDLIKDLFVSISTELDVTEPLLWGYYFTNDTEDGLKQVAEVLAGQGYTVVDLYESDFDEEDEIEPDPDSAWWLHVEKVEVHTPESLFARGEELEALAESLGVTSYDGMDVGPIEDEESESEG
jgi:hypothetical protein